MQFCMQLTEYDGRCVPGQASSRQLVLALTPSDPADRCIAVTKGQSHNAATYSILGPCSATVADIIGCTSSQACTETYSKSLVNPAGCSCCWTQLPGRHRERPRAGYNLWVPRQTDCRVYRCCNGDTWVTQTCCCCRLGPRLGCRCHLRAPCAPLIAKYELFDASAVALKAPS
jgi:hypothetical protein